MKTRILHPIRYAELQTGLKGYLIRTWEERYGAVCPQRSHTNRRLFCDDDIQRLKLLKQAVDCGHNISSVATLSDRDLETLIERSRRDSFSVDAAGSSAPEAEAVGFRSDGAQTVAVALKCIRDLDQHGLEKTLDEAAVKMPRQAFLQFVILPMFVAVGDLWRVGKLKIVNEHMASVVVRSMLWDMLRAVEVAETAPRIIVTTPVGHWHEFGALSAALSASESGWRALYLGANLPSEEIVYAVRKLDGRALTLSLCHTINDKLLSIELVKIRRSLGRRIPIFIGGAGVEAAAHTLSQINALTVSDFDEYRRQLEECAKNFNI